jgi:hypothetical protein
MGQEIEQNHFSDDDFRIFNEKLETETVYLEQLFTQNKLSQLGPVAGFEIEAWLIDNKGNPAPKNQIFLDKLNDPMVVHELSLFNIELNIEPGNLQGNVFSEMQQSLQHSWQKCQATAKAIDTDILMIGILPSIRDSDLTLRNMTKSNRYKALNEQVLKLRNGVPLHLDIHGREQLKADHFDVMLESAATSFQIHLQTPLTQAAEMFNRALLLSAPMVAVSANSPYLFGCELWDETRIPLFEQAVECGELAHRRVSFGDHYATDSLFENFKENRDDYPVLVPNLLPKATHEMAHLRFHNGTIWRWNRPLLGFDPDGTPHLRIEHRVVPAGPTIIDSIANAAFFYGMIYGLPSDEALTKLPFPLARENFYHCAKDGLHALVDWPGIDLSSIRDILLKHFIPLARKGLTELGINTADIDKYMGIIEKRVESGQNGAEWQRLYVARHGRDMTALTLRYLHHQNTGLPVAEWEI